MKVLIVGGGIGGLSAAISLQQQGHDTVIYERVKESKPIGAAISVWSNGIKVLNALGLSQQVAQHGGRMDEMAYRWFEDGQYMCRFSLEPLYTQVKQRAFPIARTHLQNMLMEKAGISNLHMGKRAINYHVDGGGVTLEFDDGSTVLGDFLVIADGTHSKLRNKVASQTIARRYAGYVNWNGQIPYKALEGLVEPQCWTTFVGEGKRVAMMPMGEGRFYFWFDASPPQGIAARSESYKEELRRHFKGWHPAVQKLIEEADSGTMARIEIHDTDPLSTLIDPSGKAVLIGDAAHATAPDLGQGGCQALEDSYVLGQLFKTEGLVGDTQVTQGKLNSITELYQKVMHALNGMDETNAFYKELEQEDGTHIMAGMSKTIMGAPIELEGQVEIRPLETNTAQPILDSFSVDT